MPIYDFECGKCGGSFEEILRSANEKVKCPHCSSRRVRRLISGFAVHGGRKTSGASGSSCSGCTATSCKDCTQ